ncbi:hypothetical protein SAMN04515674_106116 [Pseudarcicella hirudinis]|uniref:Glycosyl hydrolase family 65, N-terminal domain n=1 Tax=Pseudarcicella hirudinis TaxID=1079859 RepID=A0A1I5TMT7_9BACT|nr:hypothetical protein [Pseudarcicella hirudinis]SFP84298.1 hypothetical protein SAMN04515674_106116 [Pseudarcicella hirudinis]
MKRFSVFFFVYLFSLSFSFGQNRINRKELVERHKVLLSQIDTLGSLSVGNGHFAFSVDVTGLQTFPDFYANGIPLGTQSEWGWHSFPNTQNFKIEESLKNYQINGRSISYAVQSSDNDRSKAAINFLRQNPQRLQLGNIGFQILKKNSQEILPGDITDIQQELNPWTGEIKSLFSVEGIPIEVFTLSHQNQDIISVKVVSSLISEGRIKLRIRFPFPSNQFLDSGNNYADPEKHHSSVKILNNKSAEFLHSLDQYSYLVKFQGNTSSTVDTHELHHFIINPVTKSNSFEFSCQFTDAKALPLLPSYAEVKINNISSWASFWKRGAAVDFAGSKDPRAKELERRIILSQYLTRIQCAGKEPPQETGLTYNSWFGKPHLEMHWWHGIHFALWNRIDLLEQSLGWYRKTSAEAEKIALRQGFEGLRWQKMTDPAGKEAPSSVGAFLIWQQPHFITFAELCYREHKDLKTLQKYKDLVFKTADFMASYAYYDSAKGKYILGKGLIPAQERFKPEDTFNPTYELAYWYWGLSVAQQWRERLGLSRNKKWDDVLNNLSPLPVQDDVYLAAESAKDSYTNPLYLTDHPSVLGTFGMLPGSKMLNVKTMRKTYDKVLKIWNWKDTWGWDFPMTAMTATRLGKPEQAVDALLMNITTNTYLVNGHNFQDNRLRLYLPGNGGLLAAVALMCAGYDGCKEVNPGIPKNGMWKVKWEGLKRMP